MSFPDVKTGFTWIAKQLPNLPHIGTWLHSQADKIEQLEQDLAKCKDGVKAAVQLAKEAKDDIQLGASVQQGSADSGAGSSAVAPEQK